MRSLATLLLALLSIGASASAATITLENCASCQGSTVSLSVDPAGGGNWDVTLTLDTTNYDGSPDGVVQAGFKAISGITNSDISLAVSPDASWSDPKLAGISANGLCTGAGESDFVCTAGYTDVTANPAVYTWGFTVEGGALLTEWSIKFQYYNNVLDFARLERKQKQFDKRPLDLHAVVERAWEGHELHLQENGFTTRWQAAPGPYPVTGDEDAFAQILVNLLSNAEKYSGDRKEIELHSYLDGEFACVSVLDRGVGVPPGDERKIFESFYRAHDSLSSGITGSGLATPWPSNWPTSMAVRSFTSRARAAAATSRSGFPWTRHDPALFHTSPR